MKKQLRTYDILLTTLFRDHVSNINYIRQIDSIPELDLLRVVMTTGEVIQGHNGSLDDIRRFIKNVNKRIKRLKRGEW